MRKKEKDIIFGRRSFFTRSMLPSRCSLSFFCFFSPLFLISLNKIIQFNVSRIDLLFFTLFLNNILFIEFLFFFPTLSSTNILLSLPFSSNLSNHAKNHMRLPRSDHPSEGFPLFFFFIVRIILFLLLNPTYTWYQNSKHFLFNASRIRRKKKNVYIYIIYFIRTFNNYLEEIFSRIPCTIFTGVFVRIYIRNGNLYIKSRLEKFQ